MHILFIAYMRAYVRPYLLNNLRLPIARYHPEGSVAGLSVVIKGCFYTLEVIYIHIYILKLKV
jgi:hypothetical protein